MLDSRKIGGAQFGDATIEDSGARYIVNTLYAMPVTKLRSEKWIAGDHVQNTGVRVLYATSSVTQ